MRPPEEIRKDQVAQWVHKAEEDLGAANLLLGPGCFAAAIGFHSQQAAEKYLKAFLVWNQTDFPKTHDLGKLLDLVALTNKALSESLYDINVLTDYGVDIRYPGDIPELSLAEAKEAVALAEKVRDAVMAELPGGKK
ncbi:MAG TPA: HEPN domain-containing protein [Nitrospirota bacterium]|jgi:HEPN domain-containing protein